MKTTFPLFQMYSHFWYDAPASRLTAYNVKQKEPVYLYSFDHISENFYDLDSKTFEWLLLFYPSTVLHKVIK